MAIKLQKTNSGLALKPSVMLKRKGGDLPKFDSLFGAYPAEGIPDPLADLPIADDPDESVGNEVSAALQAIRDEKAQRRDAYRTIVDTEYWFCVCFQNRAQKDEFLRLAGWIDHGDKYLDGLEIARRMGIKIEPIKLTIKEPPKSPVMLRDYRYVGDDGE
jgi:hypothetical protein